jgi:hypothetical protein
VAFGTLKILKDLYRFLKKYSCLDLTSLQNAIETERNKLIAGAKANEALSFLKK